MKQQKLFKNFAKFDFESFGVQKETFKDNKLDRETCPDICIQFLEPCGRKKVPRQL